MKKELDSQKSYEVKYNAWNEKTKKRERSFTIILRPITDELTRKQRETFEAFRKDDSIKITKIKELCFQ